MTTSTERHLGHSNHQPRIASDGPAAGPWPGMSARAALFARAIGVAVVFAWAAMTLPLLVVVLAFALPFWIAIELEAPRFQARRAAEQDDVAELAPVLPLRRANAPTRPSRPTPQAA